MILKCRKMEEIWNYEPDNPAPQMAAYQDRKPLEENWISLLS